MPINYGTNNISTSGVISAPSGSFINSLLFNGSSVSTGGKKMLQVSVQETTMYEFQNNQLVYSNVEHDPYNGYDDSTGQYTVPSGYGGMYLVFTSFVAGIGTELLSSAYLSAVGSQAGTVSFNNGGTYAVPDGYLRHAGMIPMFLQDNETVHLDAYTTDTLNSNNDFDFFNVFALYKI